LRVLIRIADQRHGEGGQCCQEFQPGVLSAAGGKEEWAWVYGAAPTTGAMAIRHIVAKIQPARFRRNHLKRVFRAGVRQRCCRQQQCQNQQI